MFIKEEKMCQKLSKTFLILFLLIVVFLYCGLEQSAAEVRNSVVSSLEKGRKATLTVEYKQQGKSGEILLNGVEFSVHKVADLEVKNQSAKYTLTKDFYGSGVDFENMKASESNRAAKKLYDIVKRHNLKSLREKTDLSGRAKFGELAPGMYLVVQTGKCEKNNVRYYSEPFLISAPLAMLNGNTNVWEYSVVAKPKSTTKKPIPVVVKPKTGDDTIIEIWGLILIMCGILLSWMLYGTRKNAKK